MVFYIIIIFLLLCGSFSKKGKYFFFSGMFLMWAIMAFRNIDLGGFDAGFYQMFFEENPDILNVSLLDAHYPWGYTLLNSLVKTFSNEYIAYQIVYSIVAFTLLYIIIRKLKFGWQSCCVFLFSFFCFRYMWDMWVILRQNLANMLFIIFTMYLYKYWKNSKPYNSKGIMLFICAVVIPAGFHTSGWVNAISLLIFLALSKIGIEKKRVIVVVASLITYFILSPSFESILQLVAVIDTRYMMYAGDDATGNNMYYAARLVVFIFFAWFYKYIKYENKDYLITMMGMMVLIGSVNAPIVVRLCDYYAVGLYGLMGCLQEMFTKKSRLIPMAAFSVLMLLVFYRFLNIFDDGVFIEYSTYW